MDSNFFRKTLQNLLKVFINSCVFALSLLLAIIPISLLLYFLYYLIAHVLNF